MSTAPVNCENFAAFVIEDDRDMDIGDLEARSVHTKSCEDCRSFLQGFQAFKAYLAKARRKEHAKASPRASEGVMSSAQGDIESHS